LQGSELLAEHAPSTGWALFCPASNPRVTTASFTLFISALISVTESVKFFVSCERHSRNALNSSVTVALSCALLFDGILTLVSNVSIAFLTLSLYEVLSSSPHTYSLGMTHVVPLVFHFVLEMTC
jgi:hypothetical protein